MRHICLYMTLDIPLYISKEDGGMDPGYSSVHMYEGRQKEPWKDLYTEMYYLSMS